MNEIENQKKEQYTEQKQERQKKRNVNMRRQKLFLKNLLQISRSVLVTILRVNMEYRAGKMECMLLRNIC